MKCFSLIILIVILNQINGYDIECPKDTSTCIIKYARNVEEFVEKNTQTWYDHSLKFENSSLDSLHPNIFTTLFHELVSLDASSVQLKIIDNGQFNEAYYLKNLNLSNNSLKMFNTSLLIKSKPLKTLDVSNNGIEELDFEALKENNNHLEEINVSNNKITNIVISENIKMLLACNNSLTQIKIPMKSKLTDLDLSGNSLLTNVKENLKHLQLIVNLNLSDVLLEPLEIGLFVGMDKLKSLMLRNTGITKIENGTFSNLKDLRFLDLSCNKITELDMQVLLVLTNLNSLNISGNKIVIFDLFQNEKPLLMNLKEISIEQNNWECLYLTKLCNSLKNNNIETMKLQYPVKNSTNVECNLQETTLSTSTPIPSTAATTLAEKTTLTADDLTISTEEITLKVEDIITETKMEDITTTPTTTEAPKQKSNNTETKNNGSAIYKVLLCVAITLLVVAILFLVKKYIIKFNFCKPYERVDEEELLEPATEMT